MMFVPGALYKSKIGIPMTSTTGHLTGTCEWFWLAKGSLISIVAMNRHFYMIHTFCGVFRTQPFYSFSDYEESFERLA